MKSVVIIALFFTQSIFAGPICEHCNLSSNEVYRHGQVQKLLYSKVQKVVRRIPDVPYSKLCNLFRSCDNEIGYKLMDIYKEYNLNYDNMFEDIKCKVNPEFYGKTFVSYLVKVCKNYTLTMLVPILLHFKKGGPEKIKIVTKVVNSYTFSGGVRALKYIKRVCSKPEMKGKYACRTDKKGIATLAIALEKIFHAKI